MPGKPSFKCTNGSHTVIFTTYNIVITDKMVYIAKLFKKGKTLL